MHKYKSEIRAVQDSDPDFVRIEGIMVMDLQGLSSSALSAETMEVIKIASKISDYFPEVSDEAITAQDERYVTDIAFFVADERTRPFTVC